MLSTLALDGDTAYMVTSEILEMPNGAECIPQWHFDFLTFPQNYNASFTILLGRRFGGRQRRSMELLVEVLHSCQVVIDGPTL